MRDRKALLLSGGQQKLVALGRALGIAPLAVVELLPVIEAVMVTKLNEQMDHSHG